MIRRRFGRLGVMAATLALGLGGCVSLLPKAKPSQLYRFEVQAPAPVAGSIQGQRNGIVLSAIDFPRAATGDGILTVTGDETAYVEGARWVAPAAVLFREQMLKAFDNRARRALIVNPGDAGSATAILRLNVLNFETRYEGGAPTVVETVRARLTRSDGTFLDERNFDARIHADNRVSAIVNAYSQATQSVLSQLVDWSDQTVPARPNPPPTTTETITTTQATHSGGAA